MICPGVIFRLAGDPSKFSYQCFTYFGGLFCVSLFIGNGFRWVIFQAGPGVSHFTVRGGVEKTIAR